MPKIPEYPAHTTPDDNDELIIEDSIASTTKKITRGDFLAGSPLPADTVDTQAIDDGAVTPAKTALFNYQTDNANSIANVTNGAIKFQVGWGQVIGSGTDVLTDTVTYGETFTTILGASAFLVGAKSTTAASSITDFPTSYGTGAGYAIAHRPTSTSSGAVVLTRASGTFANTIYWGYSWIAWGIV